MKFSFFYHSLLSDWNHGNAHFLRGVVTELLARGHEVTVYEPEDAWSRENLVLDHGTEPIRRFYQAYPNLDSVRYRHNNLDLEAVASASDVIIVHEWNEAWLVNQLAEMRNRWVRGHNAEQNALLLFHDTHHRAVSDPAWIKNFRLDVYDGILAFGDVLSDVYRRHGWHERVWTWHEAADTRVFRPREPDETLPSGDVVWIGNWGDDERTEELETFLFGPVSQLELKCNIYGVRYPRQVVDTFDQRHINYHGWLANFDAPRVFANHKVTVHVPRRYYRDRLPGIPTIRPFEAMASGIPLVTAPWQDSENLFTPGKDFLLAHDSADMKRYLKQLILDQELAKELADHALHSILTRHTCGHRVSQLLNIVQQLTGATEKQVFPNQSTSEGRAAHAYQ